MTKDKEKRMTPEMRFKGFSDDWEQRKASELFKSISDKKHPNLPVLSASQEKGMILRDDIGIDIKYDHKSLSNYKRVTPGQFVIHLRSFQGGFADSQMEGITSPAYTVIDFKERDPNHSLFWKEILTSQSFIKRLETVTYGIRDGRSISFSDFSTLKFLVPKLDEQVSIANLFNLLDTTITLHQQKYELLLKLKKAYLQLIFPKTGESTPKVRFADFHGSWEQRKLGDEVINIGTGRSNFSSSVKQSKEKPFAVLGSTSIISYSSEYDHSGDFVLTARVGANAGNLYKFTGNVKISDNTVYIQADNLNFIFYLLTKFDVKRISFGTGQPLVKASELKNLNLYFPGDIERQRIGTLFKQLDDIITLHQQKIVSLKSLKQAYLQKMFV